MKQSHKQMYIAGRNAVKEALSAGRVMHCYFSGRAQGELAEIEMMAKRCGIPVSWLAAGDLQELVPHVRHQGWWQPRDRISMRSWILLSEKHYNALIHC